MRRTLINVPIGDDRLNLVARRAALEAAQVEKLQELAKETDDEFDLRASKQRSRLHDPEYLRGLPAVGRGVAGALKGSTPGRGGIFR